MYANYWFIRLPLHEDSLSWMGGTDLFEVAGVLRQVSNEQAA